MSVIVADSNLSWVVAIGNSIIGFCTLGFSRCLPVFFYSFMDEFNASYSQVAFISGLFCFGLGFGSLVLPFVAKKFGYRKVAFATGLFFALSYTSSTLVHRFELLQLLVGLAGGFGSGLLFFSALVTCNLYFSKHKTFATGIATVGIPIGALSLSPLANYLIVQYGWRGALLILSGVLYNTCVSAALYMGTTSTPTAVRERTIGPKRRLSRRKSVVEAWGSVKQFGDCSMFSCLTYDLALLSSIFYMCGYIGGNTFLVIFAKGQLSASSMKSALTLSLVSVTEIISRILTGVLGDKNFISRSLLLSITSAIFACVLLVIPFCKQYESLVAVCLMYGMVSCTYQSVIPVVFGDIVGKARLSQALGYQGFLYNMLLGPSLWLNGYLLDVSGDYRIPFFLCSGFVAISTCFIFIIWLRTRENRPTNT